MRALLIPSIGFFIALILGFVIASQLRDTEQLPILNDTAFYGSIRDEGVPAVEEEQLLYRIRWHSVNNSATGYGSEGYPLEQAQLIANTLNEQNRGFTRHNIELIK